MRPPIFVDTKIKQEIAVNPLPRNNRIRDFYKALYKIYMISIENMIKLYYEKSAMTGKKRVKQNIVL